RGAVPRFWTAEVLDHYEQLMVEVARRYEPREDLCEVVASGAMTVFAEPLYRPQRDDASHRRLAAAGLNADTDRDAQAGVRRIHRTVAPRARTALDVNAGDLLDADGRRPASVSAARDLVLRARELMGEKLVLPDNGLRPRFLPARGPAQANIH